MEVETLTGTPRRWNRGGCAAVAAGFVVRFAEDLRGEAARLSLNGGLPDKLGPGKGK